MRSLSTLVLLILLFDLPISMAFSYAIKVYLLKPNFVSIGSVAKLNLFQLYGSILVSTFAATNITVLQALKATYIYAVRHCQSADATSKVLATAS